MIAEPQSESERLAAYLLQRIMCDNLMWVEKDGVGGFCLVISPQAVEQLSAVVEECLEVVD